MANAESHATVFLDIVPGMTTGLSTLTAGLSSINQQFQNVTSAINSQIGLINTSFITVGVLASQFAWKATQAFGDYEQGLKIAQAVSNQTAADMRQMSSAVEDFAVKYRTELNDLTEGLQTLGRAGLNSVTEQTEVLENGLQTAKLEGRELNSVLEELIQNTALLGGDLKSNNFGEQSEYVNDLLVATSMSAPITTHDISETLKYSGGMLAAAGGDINSQEGKDLIEDYMGTVAAFAQKGVSGSIAGTALRAFFNKPATQDSSVLEGLSAIHLAPEYLWEDGGERMKPVSQQIALIQGQMDKLNVSTMDQMQIWSKIVGGKMGQQMMKLEAGDIRSLTRDIQDAQSASDVAQQSMDTFNMKLKSAAEAGEVAYVKFGEHIATVLKPILDIITPIMEALSHPVINEAAFIAFIAFISRALNAAINIVRRLKIEFGALIAEIKTAWTMPKDEYDPRIGQIKALQEQKKREREIQARDAAGEKRNTAIANMASDFSKAIETLEKLNRQLAFVQDEIKEMGGATEKTSQSMIVLGEKGSQSLTILPEKMTAYDNTVKETSTSTKGLGSTTSSVASQIKADIAAMHQELIQYKAALAGMKTESYNLYKPGSNEWKKDLRYHNWDTDNELSKMQDDFMRGHLYNSMYYGTPLPKGADAIGQHQLTGNKIVVLQKQEDGEYLPLSNQYDEDGRLRPIRDINSSGKLKLVGNDTYSNDKVELLSVGSLRNPMTDDAREEFAGFNRINSKDKDAFFSYMRAQNYLEEEIEGMLASKMGASNPDLVLDKISKLEEVKEKLNALDQKYGGGRQNSPVANNMLADNMYLKTEKEKQRQAEITNEVDNLRKEQERLQNADISKQNSLLKKYTDEQNALIKETESKYDDNINKLNQQKEKLGKKGVIPDWNILRKADGRWGIRKKQIHNIIKSDKDENKKLFDTKVWEKFYKDNWEKPNKSKKGPKFENVKEDIVIDNFIKQIQKMPKDTQLEIANLLKDRTKGNQKLNAELVKSMTDENAIKEVERQIEAEIAAKEQAIEELKKGQRYQDLEKQIREDPDVVANNEKIKKLKEKRDKLNQEYMDIDKKARDRNKNPIDAYTQEDKDRDEAKLKEALQEVEEKRDRISSKKPELKGMTQEEIDKRIAEIQNEARDREKTQEMIDAYYEKHGGAPLDEEKMAGTYLGKDIPAPKSKDSKSPLEDFEKQSKALDELFDMSDGGEYKRKIQQEYNKYKEKLGAAFVEPFENGPLNDSFWTEMEDGTIKKKGEFFVPQNEFSRWNMGNFSMDDIKELERLHKEQEKINKMNDEELEKYVRDRHRVPSSTVTPGAAMSQIGKKFEETGMDELDVHGVNQTWSKRAKDKINEIFSRDGGTSLGFGQIASNIANLTNTKESRAQLKSSIGVTGNRMKNRISGAAKSAANSLKSFGSSVMSFVGGEFAALTIAFEIAVQLWNSYHQAYQESLQKAKKQLDDATNSIDEAETALKSLYKEENPDATAAQQNDYLLSLYGAMVTSENQSAEQTDQQNQILGNMKSITKSYKNQVDRIEQDEDGNYQVIKKEEELISTEDEHSRAVQENSEALMLATQELQIAMDKFVSTATHAIFGLDGLSSKITDTIGNVSTLGNNGEWAQDGSFALTSSQRGDDYQGNTDMAGLMLEDIKDAHAEARETIVRGGKVKEDDEVKSGYSIFMGKDSADKLVRAVQNPMGGRTAAGDSMYQHAANINRLSAAQNARVQQSMKINKRDWQQLGKEMAKYEKATGKHVMSGDTGNKRIENLIKKLSLDTRLDRANVTRMAQLSQLQDMYQVAETTFLPIFHQQMATSMAHFNVAQGTISQASGDAANGAVSTANNSAQIAAYLSVLAYQAAVDYAHDRAIQTGEFTGSRDDFLAYAAKANNGNPIDQFFGDMGWTGQGLSYQRAADMIMTGYYTPIIAQLHPEMSSDEVAQKALDIATQDGIGNKQLDARYGTASRWYQSVFTPAVDDAYAASDIGEPDSGSGSSGGGGGGGGGGSDKGDDSKNTKNRVDLVLCNKKEIPKLNVNLFKKEPSFTVLNKNFKVRDIKVNTQDKPKAILSSVKNAIIDVEKRTDPKIIQDEEGEYDPVAATEGNSTPKGNTSTKVDS